MWHSIPTKTSPENIFQRFEKRPTFVKVQNLKNYFKKKNHQHKMQICITHSMERERSQENGRLREVA